MNSQWIKVMPSEHGDHYLQVANFMEDMIWQNLAKIVADKLLDLKVRDNMSGYFVLLSNTYADEGNWEYFDRLRKERLEEGGWL
ncbi:hypothetical protein Dimus_033728 [Dionaea muscipula]